MLSTFSSISPHLKFKSKLISINNIAFKFHYRATFILLLVCTILVTSRQYIGEHINCIVDKNSLPEKPINSFCFFTTTFSVAKHFNETNLQAGHNPYPGIGPSIDKDKLHYHAYYQWVPFFLFSQAIMFYLPHLLWRSWEGGKIKALVDGLQMIGLSKYMGDKGDLEINKIKIPSVSTTNKKVAQIRIAFRQHIEINYYWAIKYMITELLNFLNLLLQFYITNRFLSGKFLNLGFDYINDDFEGKMTSLDMIFPKLTKCDFYKYGASGSIQRHDILCVMALNVINEKIFTFLWFWYIILGIISMLAIIWRIISFCLHSRSTSFNEFIFSLVSPGRINSWDLSTVTKNIKFSDWLFLYYLAKNMEPFIFREILMGIAGEFRAQSKEHLLNDDDDPPIQQFNEQYIPNYNELAMKVKKLNEEAEQ